jgi:hypothetical protein
MGFVYSDLLTEQTRSKASEDAYMIITNPMNENDQSSFQTGQHIWGSMLVRRLSAFGFALYSFTLPLILLSDHGAQCLPMLWIMITSLHIGFYQPSCCIQARARAFVCRGTIFDSFFSRSPRALNHATTNRLFLSRVTECQRMAVTMEICKI